MIGDRELGEFVSWLGIFIMFLLVVYHYVTADPSFQHQKQ
jgi:hypothetical protein